MNPRPPSRSVRAGYAIVTLMLVFVVAFTCFAVVSLGVGVARGGESLLWGDTLTVPASVDPDTLHLPEGVKASGSPHVQLEVKDPSTKQMLIRSLMDFGPLALFIAILAQLRAIARSVKDGDPFGEANTRRLRRIGALVVGGAVAVELINGWLHEWLFNNLPARYSDFTSGGFDLPGNALLAGLAAFILAEVFAYGLSLREDVEGTI